MMIQESQSIDGWFRGTFKARLITNPDLKGTKFPGFSGAYQIELIGVKRLKEGEFVADENQQISNHEFVNDVVVDRIGDFVPNPGAYNFRKIEIHTPHFTEIGFDDGLLFGGIEGFAKAYEFPVGADHFSTKLRHVSPNKPSSRARSCFDHPSGCWSLAFPGNSSSCFNPYTRDSTGLTACFGGQGTGCSMMPGCFGVPSFRIGWNILSLIGALSLILLFLCHLSNYSVQEQDQPEQKYRDDDFVEEKNQPEPDDQGYDVQESGGRSLQGRLMFSVSDHKDIDGDVIDIYVNDEVLVSNLELTGDPYKLTSSDLVVGDLNSIKVYPVSVGRGSEKVCTARIIMYDECTGLEMPAFRMMLRQGEVGEYLIYAESNSCD
jgi:hypothetical protein